MKRYAKFVIAAVIIAALILATIFIGFEVIGILLFITVIMSPLWIYCYHLASMTEKEFEEFMKNYIETMQYLNRRPFGNDMFL